jgi:hypothetical protein
MTMALAYVDHLDSVEALTRFFERVIDQHGLDIYLWLVYALHIYVAVRIVVGVTRWFRKRKAKRHPYRTVVRTQQLMRSQSPSPIRVLPSVPNSAEEDRHSSARKSDDSDVMAFPM